MMVKKEAPVLKQCYHCGDECKSKAISIEGKDFCCEGCKTVFELLDSNNLCNYYQFNNSPGNKINNGTDSKYAYLDNETIKNRLLDFREKSYSKITFYIPGIHCSSCIWLLENLHKFSAGVIRSQINFLKKELTVIFNEEIITLREVAEILDSTGYTPQISLSQLDKKESKKKTNHQLFKLGIAGFCFGNIMLLSFPDYLKMDSLEAGYGHFFAYLSLFLSLPVFLYCDSEFFTSAYNGLKKRIINIDLPIALGLLVIFARSVYEILSHTGPGYLDSFAGLVFFMLIGRWYQRRTYDALAFERDYKSYFPVSVTKISEDNKEIIPINELKPLDRILIRNQELIPADAKILNGIGNIDYSFVTGESVPVRKEQGCDVFAGGRQVGGTLELEIQKEISQSYFTDLWNQDVFKKEKNESIENFANKTGKIFTIAVIILSMATFTYWWLNDYSKAVQSFAAVLIVFCPCMLALSIPFCFNNAMRIFGRHGFYLKSTETVEQIAKVDTIVFDKTGTITTVNDSTEFIGEELSNYEKILIKSLTKHSTHPLSQIVAKSLTCLDAATLEEFEEMPSQGITGKVDGNLVKIGTRQFVSGETKQESDPFSKVHISIKGMYRGYFRIENKLREGLPGLILSLGKKYDLHLLSGDNSQQKENMLKLFPKEQNVHFSQKPLDKLEYIKRLQEQGKTVLMVGDGLNDAGALKQSDAGITVSDDVYNFSPSCDAIIDSNKLRKLNEYVRFCKSSLTTVKASLIISLFYNILGLSFAMAGKLNPLVAAVLMPASSVSVVLFVTITSNIIAKKKGLI